ncbi:MAG: protein translocase subunit SecD [Candidatus Parcubacteria bacterium]|nr:MAG: protein translocase subunit SecD [Candidatus Parcubacteria bacterium]
MDKNNLIIFTFFILFLISLIFSLDNSILDFKFGLDLTGGVLITYDADLRNVKLTEINDVLSGVKDLIERRINTLGIAETNISYTNSGRLIVEIPNIKDPQEAINLIGQTPLLEFRIPKVVGTTTYFLPSELTGRYLENVEFKLNPQTAFPIISLKFNKEGSKIFEELTKKYLNQPIAIYIDNKPISTPIVRQVISGGEAVIEGNFDLLTAKKLANDLKQGALPVPLYLKGITQINPLFGEKFKYLSLKAGIIGFLLVVIFMIIFYRLQGIIASICLIVYIFLNIFIYKLFGIVLTLAGIAGLILSIGMAVDANILIAERIREEIKWGLNKKEAVITGFKRAWTSIRDSNVSTIISAIIVYFLATSFIKGFAITLSIGVIISFITAFYLTRLLTQKIYDLSI